VGDVRRGGLPPAAGRTVNPALFLVVGICFFLPFFTVECSAAIPEALEGLAEGLGEGQQFDFGNEDLSQSVTGWQLVIGDTGEAVPQGQGAAQAEVQDPGPDLVAVAAFAVAALGLALSWMRRPIGPLLAIVLGVAGTVLLIVLWIRITGRIPQQARAFVDLRAEPAFWIAVVVSGLAAMWGAIRLFLERRRPRAMYEPASSSGPAGPPSQPPPPTREQPLSGP
jgi:hypothetical protein